MLLMDALSGYYEMNLTTRELSILLEAMSVACNIRLFTRETKCAVAQWRTGCQAENRPTES